MTISPTRRGPRRGLPLPLNHALTAVSRRMTDASLSERDPAVHKEYRFGGRRTCSGWIKAPLPVRSVQMFRETSWSISSSTRCGCCRSTPSYQRTSGTAIAERWLAATFNRDENEIVDHCTYVLAGDGSPDGRGDVGGRIASGDTSARSFDHCASCRRSTPEEGRFYVAEEALCEFRKAISKGSDLETAWQRRVDSCRIAHPTLANQFEAASCVWRATCSSTNRRA
jgi:hypothetical protein